MLVVQQRPGMTGWSNFKVEQKKSCQDLRVPVVFNWLSLKACVCVCVLAPVDTPSYQGDSAVIFNGNINI